MPKRLLALPLVLLLAACAALPSLRDPAVREHDIASLQAAFESGELSSVELVRHYLQRVERLDRRGPRLNAIIEINPDALAAAAELDRERRLSGPRGPLHGVPIVLKANIDTGDRMATSAGSLGLAGHHAPDDAFLVARLREAGAVLLGKTNLSEWANFRSTRSVSGWSSLGGQTRNPHEPARNPCGSSSGSAVAVAADLAMLAVGTETDGSIICPAAVNGIVGVKPSLGLVSRDGILPIAHSQDTAGPMARSVRDAAVLLSVLAVPDPTDAAASGRDTADYASALDVLAVRGARIGVLRSHSGAGSDPRVGRVLDDSIAALAEAGAVIIDPVEVDTEGLSEAEYEVLLYEFRSDLDAYLRSANAPLRSLDEVIAYNAANAERVMPHFGQDIMLAAQAKGPLTDTAYRQALTDSKRIARTGIEQAMNTHGLVALIAPSNGPAWLTDPVLGDHFSIGSASLAAIAGYPNVTVPAGFVAGLPVGLSFFGRDSSEQTLLNLAYAFEQATRARRAPDYR